MIARRRVIALDQPVPVIALRQARPQTHPQCEANVRGESYVQWRLRHYGELRCQATRKELGA